MFEDKEREYGSFPFGKTSVEMGACESQRRSFCASCFGTAVCDRGEFAIHKQVGIPRGRLSPDAMGCLSPAEAHLLLAAAQQNETVLKEILAKGVRVDTYDENRTSPLHIACRHGSLPVLKALLDGSAPVNITDCAGWAPLHVASYCQKPEAVQLLLDHEADPTICNARGETPWDMASDPRTQAVFKDYYRLQDHCKEPASLGSSMDLYLSAPLDLSALENSALHEGLFPKPCGQLLGKPIAEEMESASPDLSV